MDDDHDADAAYRQRLRELEDLPLARASRFAVGSSSSSSGTSCASARAMNARRRSPPESVPKLAVGELSTSGAEHRLLDCFEVAARLALEQ